VIPPCGTARLLYDRDRNNLYVYDFCERIGCERCLEIWVGKVEKRILWNEGRTGQHTPGFVYDRRYKILVPLKGDVYTSPRTLPINSFYVGIQDITRQGLCNRVHKAQAGALALGNGRRLTLSSHEVVPTAYRLPVEELRPWLRQNLLGRRRSWLGAWSPPAPTATEFVAAGLPHHLHAVMGLLEHEGWGSCTGTDGEMGTGMSTEFTYFPGRDVTFGLALADSYARRFANV